MPDEALSNILQENLLSLLCFDDKHAAIIRGLVPEDAFEGLYREVARTVYGYVDTQKEAPKAHLPDLFDTVIESNDKKAAQYRNVLKHLNSTFKDVNAAYVMTRLHKFIRLQALKGATMGMIEVLQENKVDDDVVDRLETIMANAMRQRLEVFDPGISLGNKATSLAYLDTMEDEVFHTGIKELDAAKLGPMRKGLHLLIGLKKSGKTWWLVNLAKNSFLEGRRTLHISLEMDEQKIARRYHQALFAMCKRRPTNEREALWQTKFTLNDLARLEGLDRHEMKPKLALSDADIRRKLEQRIDKFGVRLDRMRIKSFPSGMLTMRGLVAYLDSLEMREGFTPDLLIVDYPRIMKLDPKNETAELGRITVELRGVCVERNIAGAIVAQSNRGGMNKKRLDSANIGTDFSQTQTVDTVLTYSQTEFERRLGLARIFVDSAREESDKWAVLIAQSYATGQFCRDSVRMRDDYWNILDKYRGAEDAADEETDDTGEE